MLQIRHAALVLDVTSKPFEVKAMIGHMLTSLTYAQQPLAGSQKFCRESTRSH